MALEYRKRKPTKKEIERFTSQILYDRIAWVAARTILENVRNDSLYSSLDPVLRRQLEEFLARHPAATPLASGPSR